MKLKFQLSQKTSFPCFLRVFDWKKMVLCCTAFNPKEPCESEHGPPPHRKLDLDSFHENPDSENPYCARNTIDLCSLSLQARSAPWELVATPQALPPK